MKRKYFVPVLFVCFCLTIILWLNYAAKDEKCVDVGGGTCLIESTTKYIVAESDTLLNGKHYVQVIDAAGKKVNVASYICHIIYFFAALAIFILMLIILDITKED